MTRRLLLLALAVVLALGCDESSSPTHSIALPPDDLPADVDVTGTWVGAWEDAAWHCTAEAVQVHLLQYENRFYGTFPTGCWGGGFVMEIHGDLNCAGGVCGAVVKLWTNDQLTARLQGTASQDSIGVANHESPPAKLKLTRVPEDP